MALGNYEPRQAPEGVKLVLVVIDGSGRYEWGVPENAMRVPNYVIFTKENIAAIKRNGQKVIYGRPE